MFYVNNKQVLGLFLNGNNYNYMSFGFGKIIPENRNAQFAYINLAQRYLSQYRVEYGNIQSGYDNFPIARLDCPVNGIFHGPLTYYYGGNIVPTKNVLVYINNGYSAIRGPVYNDIHINGNIVYFAENSDFQGHNVLIHPEGLRSKSPYFNGAVMDNCSNFFLNAYSRFSKSSQVALYACRNFSGNFNFFNDNDGTRFPGFRGFLHTCRDGSFNFNLINMHGGDSGYYNFSCISNCNNIKLNINGSPWQAWVHPNCYSSNCNITTRYIVPGFDRMSYCNFNIYLPSSATVEKSAYYSLLSNSSNCNYTVNGLSSNIVNFVNESPRMFEGLNNCNLNLIFTNSTGLDCSFGYNLHNCNIQFDNLKANLSKFIGWCDLYNCNISGNVESPIFSRSFLEHSDGLNVNINAAKSDALLTMWECNKVNGSFVCGNTTYMYHSRNLILNLYNGNYFKAINARDSKFEFYNVNNVEVYGASNSNFNMRNVVGTAILQNLNNVYFVERGGANYNITSLDNCNNSWIYANTMYGTIENVYNTRIELKNNNAYFETWRVDNCEITGFTRSAHYTTNCIFIVSIPQAVFRNSSYVKWDNVWPHATPRGSDGWNTLYRTKAGLRSVDNFSSCYLNCNNGSLIAYGETFNNINNMQCDIKTFYNGVVTANLPIYNMGIRLNVDCETLNLGIFQSGPPHGFENSCISANDIYAKNTSAYYVQISNSVRLYCENFCDVPFHVTGYGTNEPVMLINNYRAVNSSWGDFVGGLTRIGRLDYPAAAPTRLYLNNNACVFINNAVLKGADVNHSLLFVGSNVTWTSDINATNGGRVRNAANFTDDDIRFIDKGQFAWNLWDYGPWGSYRLIDYCTNV